MYIKPVAGEWWYLYYYNDEVRLHKIINVSKHCVTIKTVVGPKEVRYSRLIKKCSPAPCWCRT